MLSHSWPAPPKGNGNCATPPPECQSDGNVAKTAWRGRQHARWINTETTRHWRLLFNKATREISDETHIAL
jgi:hypothetical protein